MRWLRFPDLVGRGIVNSRMTLHRLIRDHEFPAGVLLTPNARAWSEAEIDAWIASRPTAKKASTRKPKSLPDVVAAA
jgi:predicted DNA-binding transcriptional regulator AlpA